jgi:transglutaminase-like putative cysteine protease
MSAEQNQGIPLPDGHILQGYLGPASDGLVYKYAQYGKWGVFNGGWMLTNLADGFFTISGTNLPANPYAKMAVSVFHIQSGIGVWNYQEGAGPFDYSVFFKLNQGLYRIALLAGPNTEGNWQRLAMLYIVNINTNDLSYLVPSYWVQSLNPAIVKTAQKITEGLPTDKDKVIEIHDWVAMHCSYHTDPNLDDTALQVLQTGKAVFWGYCSLTAALCRAVGIPAKIVHGFNQADGKITGSHSWNEIYFQGAWHIVDVTRDDPASFKSGHNDYPDGINISYKYFDPDRSKYYSQYTKIVEIIQK